ncbi:MAG: glycine--tRNA ligase subunit beta, partial [Pseudomonadota bacterium]
VTIKNADDYADALAHAHVIVDHEKRAGIIREGARKAARAAGLTVIEDEGLVVENAGLTEWPVPLLGRFDEAFLEVPPEVIQLTARVNQKYFVCEERAPDGTTRLANAFICTANIAASDPAVVVDGNRKVLAARLADARFFWELDQKTMLAEHAQKLERITFHEKLGSVADKVDRVAKLARWLVEEGIVGQERVPAQAGTSIDEAQDRGRSQPALGLTREKLANLAEQAARLCKADLVTEMVGEFPELQGLMGGYYAEKEGLDPQVAAAIRDHYKPVGQGDDLPTAPVTVAVSLADKLDNVREFYRVGEKPTGSKDPFALRRTAIGIARLTIENRLSFSLVEAMTADFPDGPKQLIERTVLKESGFDAEALSATFAKFDESWREAFLPVNRALESYRFELPKIEVPKIRLPEIAIPQIDTGTTEAFAAVGKAMEANTAAIVETLSFVTDRLKVQQREAGVRHDLIDAVFALGGEDDLVRLLARVHALQAFIETENGANLLAGYKRAANILKKEDYEATSVTPAQAGVQLGEDDQAALDPRLRGDDGAADDKSFSYTPEIDEKALLDALEVAEPKAIAAIEAERFEDAMAALATLRSAVDRFFDNVVVNAPEQDKRAARLALLARFRNAVHRVADFSRIEG